VEGFYDEAFAVPEMLQEIRANNHCDGHIVACFDDTGVDAARCIADGPVIGICEAGCIAAGTISNRYSIVTTLSRSVPALQHLVHKYGQERRCVSIRASDIPVLELEEQAPAAMEKLERECLAAIEQDGAEALLLGCAGMTTLTSALSEKLSLPVVDGVGAAVKQIEGLVSMKLTSSRVNGYRKPVAKKFEGDFARYSVEP
jgi:allantoin racemase